MLMYQKFLWWPSDVRAPLLVIDHSQFDMNWLRCVLGQVCHAVHITRSFQILSGTFSTFIKMSSICYVHECRYLCGTLLAGQQNVLATQQPGMQQPCIVLLFWDNTVKRAVMQLWRMFGLMSTFTKALWLLHRLAACLTCVLAVVIGAKPCVCKKCKDVIVGLPAYEIMSAT